MFSEQSSGGCSGGLISKSKEIRIMSKWLEIEITEKQCDTLAAISRKDGNEIHDDDAAGDFITSMLDKMLAAQDMYEALSNLLPYFSMRSEPDFKLITREAELALAKAEGKV